MEENNILDYLALEAQRCPPKSKERQRYLERLIQEILKYNQLRCSNKQSYEYHIYLEVCNEALQRTFSEICHRIDQYNHSPGALLKWVKSLLHYRCIDAWNEYHNIYSVTEDGQKKKIYIESLNKPIQSSQQSNPVTSDISLLETIPQPELEFSRDEELRKLIEQDPTGEFQQTHIRNHSEASFQAIALCRLEGQSWEEISKEWEISVSTLSSFYQRCIDKFVPTFKQYL